MKAPAASPLLSVEDVKAFYGPIAALKGVTLHVKPGEIVTLIGANGAGKSTLMMTIFGKPRATQGRILFDGEDITRQPTHEIARRGIALAPEGRRVFPRMTIFENLQMGARDKTGFARNLDRAYTLFPRLAERARQRAGTLSGGEQQMLAIARAMMSAPRLLLLDEPSLGLAPLMIKEIYDALAKLNREEGLSLFLVEQNAYHALRLATRGYVLVNGEINRVAPASELLNDEGVRTAYFGVA